MNYKSRIMKQIASGDKHEWGCLMMDFPEETAKKIQAWAKDNINADNLYKENYPGLEDHTHTTVVYGLGMDTDREEIKKYIENLNSPIKLTLNKVTKFDTDEKYDVIKIDIDSQDLHDLHKEIEKKFGLPGNTHKNYHPHLTLAKVKKGTEDELVGKDPFAGEKFELTQFDYSCPEKEGEKDLHTKYMIEKKANMNYKKKIYAKLIKSWVIRNAGPTIDKKYFDFSGYAEKMKDMTDKQLWYASRDAKQAAEAMRGHNPSAEGWYMDEYYTCMGELKKRGANF